MSKRLVKIKKSHQCYKCGNFRPVNTYMLSNYISVYRQGPKEVYYCLLCEGLISIEGEDGEYCNLCGNLSLYKGLCDECIMQKEIEYKFPKPEEILMEPSKIRGIDPMPYIGELRLMTEYDLKNLKKLFLESIRTLNKIDAKVIMLRFGFINDCKTLDEIAEVLKVTRERVRQREAKALRRLRHPRYSRNFKDYLDKNDFYDISNDLFINDEDANRIVLKREVDKKREDKRREEWRKYLEKLEREKEKERKKRRDGWPLW